MRLRQHGLVLVVEDDEHVRRLLVTLLRRSGLTAVPAADADAAVEAARDTPPDVVLLDLLLPGGGGLAAIGGIRSVAGRDVPVIVLSGLDPDVHGPRSREAGATAHLAKPVRPHELLAAVAAALAPAAAAGDRVAQVAG
jgi:DNA-binding response OmpR family regulator